MWKHKYGEFQDNQISQTKQYIRKQIYFLLLCVDPETKDEYPNIDVAVAFDGLLRKLGGLNEVLFCPPELVKVIALLEAALIEFNNPDFQFGIYRKLVLDAGSEVLKIKEVE